MRLALAMRYPVARHSLRLGISARSAHRLPTREDPGFSLAETYLLSAAEKPHSAIPRGPLSAPVKQRWFSECRSLLKWTIQESSAPTVIALGRYAYESVVRAYDTKLRRFRDVVEDGLPIHLDGHRLLFAVFHPAGRPKDRTFSQMQADWSRIAGYLKADKR
jgi:hypothetical protein